MSRVIVSVVWALEKHVPCPFCMLRVTRSWLLKVSWEEDKTLPNWRPFLLRDLIDMLLGTQSTWRIHWQESLVSSNWCSKSVMYCLINALTWSYPILSRRAGEKPSGRNLIEQMEFIFSLFLVFPMLSAWNGRLWNFMKFSNNISTVQLQNSPILIHFFRSFPK